MSIKGQIQALARDLDEEDEARFNLWLLLPSYEAAYRAHGDFSVELGPSTADVMKEAAMFIAEKPSPEMLKENSWYCCPCGQCGESFGVVDASDEG